MTECRGNKMQYLLKFVAASLITATNRLHRLWYCTGYVCPGFHSHFKEKSAVQQKTIKYKNNCSPDAVKRNPGNKAYLLPGFHFIRAT